MYSFNKELHKRLFAASGTANIRNGDNMNLSQLYYFRKLAQLQHYTKAAQELSITQPSLSGAIHSLEEELGVELFQKKGRNVVLTKNGGEFYQYVVAALSELDKGVDIMQERAKKLKGEIELGCVNVLLGAFIPMAVKEFQDFAGPLVHVSAHMAQTQRIIENVRSGNWDIGFCSYLDIDDNLEFTPVLEQPLVVAVLKDHPLSDRHTITMQDLREYDMITYNTDMPIGKDIRKLCEDNQIANVEYDYSTEEALFGALLVNRSPALMLKNPFVVQNTNIHILELSDVPHDFHLIYMVQNTKCRRRYRYSLCALVASS